MNKRTGIALLQNAAIFLLGLSALFLLLRVLSYETGQTDRLSAFSNLLSSEPVVTSPHSADLTDMAAPFHLVTTSAYGRGGVLAWDGEQGEHEIISDFLSEALGSAENLTAVDEHTFRSALSFPGIYIDCFVPLSADVVAGRLNASFSQTSLIRHLLITAEQEEGATLYLWDGVSAVCRYDTAAAVSVLEEVIAAYPADDTFFAFEGGEQYAHLAPYSLMRHSAPTVTAVSSSVPALATSSEQLLSLLDFNVHTESRYHLSNGTEVIVEAPRTLRVQPDGVTVYSADEETDSPLFRVPSAGAAPTAAEAALACRNLTETLFSSAELATTKLYLSQIQTKADGYILRFHYMVNGIPVYFSDDSYALEVVISGKTITSFTLRWRQYTMREESHTLLPALQAAAVAKAYRTPLLTIGYTDTGSDTLLPYWLAR